MSNIDPNIIQRYLVAGSDLLQDRLLGKFFLDRTNTEKIPDLTNCILLNAGPNGISGSTVNDIKFLKDKLDPSDADVSIIKQHELLPSSPIVSSNAAQNLFQTRNDNLPFESYKINYYIVVPLIPSGSSLNNYTKEAALEALTNKPKLYKINLQAIPTDSNNRVMPLSVQIKSKAKDSFTATSAFTVNMVFKYSDFNDLLEPTVEAVPIEFPAKYLEAPGDGPATKLRKSLEREQYAEFNKQKIPLLKILYKLIDINASKLESRSSFKDNDGLLLIQELVLDALVGQVVNPKAKEEERVIYKEYFATAKQEFETNTFYKNYYLTYHKHSFELSNEQISLNNNTFTLDFVSYEADPSRSNGFLGPSISNIYELIDSPLINRAELEERFKSGETSYFSSLAQALNNIKEYDILINKINIFLSCSKHYEKIKKTKPDQVNYFNDQTRDIKNFTANLDGRPQSFNFKFERLLAADKTPEDALKFISQFSDKIKQLKNFINRALGIVLTKLTTVYSIEVDYKSLETYEIVDAARNLQKNFSTSELVTATETGAALGSFTKSPQGVAIGAAAGAGTYLGYVGIKSLIEGETRSTLNSVVEIRKNISTSLDSLKNEDFDIIKSAQEVGLFGNITDVKKREQAIGARTLEGDERSQKDMADYFRNQVGNVELRDFEYQGKAKLSFILLGDILNLLKNYKIKTTGSDGVPTEFEARDSIRFIVGGIPTVDTPTEYSFLNYFFFPISLSSWSAFIGDNIINRPEQNYNAEVFLQDVIEKLVKAPLKSAEQTFVNGTRIPTNMKISSTLHVRPADPREDIITELSVNVSSTEPLEKNKYLKLKRHLSKTKNFSKLNSPLSVYKTYTIVSDEEIKNINFYEEFTKSTSRPRPGGVRTSGNKNYNSEEFKDFLISKYLFPCFRVYPSTGGKPFDLVSGANKQLSFTRIDNQNLNTANLLAGRSVFRQAYNFTATIRGMLNFFMGVGQYVFVLPPAVTDQLDDVLKIPFSIPNTFGFGGLYLIKETTFTTNFPVQNNTSTLTVDQANIFSISSLNVSLGDGFTGNANTPRAPSRDSLEFCNDLANTILK